MQVTRLDHFTPQLGGGGGLSQDINNVKLETIIEIIRLMIIVYETRSIFVMKGNNGYNLVNKM